MALSALPNRLYMALSVEYSYDKSVCAWWTKMDGPVTICLIETTLVCYAVQDNCTSATWRTRE
jgi:hypothetical protein